VPRRAARVDLVQAEIVACLRAAGCTVWSLAREGQGVPDILCGRAGQNYLLEAKSRAGKLTKCELEWHLTWRGSVVVVRSVDDALRAVGLEREGRE
jgi:hypothetical protein